MEVFLCDILIFGDKDINIIQDKKESEKEYMLFQRLPVGMVYI